jgi:hypothetical protein
MSDEPKPATGRSYHIGDVGPGARVAQGENISWMEGVAKLPDGESLAQQFTALLERIAQDKSLDEDTRALAQDKTKAVAEGLAQVEESSGVLPAHCLIGNLGLVASHPGSAARSATS